MTTTDLALIQHRRDTAANWILANTILASGEAGLETDTKLAKMGDGTTAWNSLGYMPEQLAAQIHLATSKATPVSGDELAISDSAATFGLKKTTIANLTTMLFANPTFTGTVTIPSATTLTDPKIVRAVNDQTGTTYTFVLTDASKEVTFANASPVTGTLPTNASVALPVGSKIFGKVIGAGLFTLVGAGGVTVVSQGTVSASPTIAAGGSWEATKTAADTWYVTGDVVKATAATKVVQVVNFQTGTTATGTTVLPNDGTIPQNTEGDQYMSLAITPTSATNILTIQVVAFYLCGVNLGDIGTVLFQDSTVNALAAINQRVPASTGAISALTYRMVAGTTSATTFKVRIGNGSAGTTTFCPNNYGQVVSSSIIITESTP